ncbi:hypothetical protein F5Y15DRAFT_219487 [Xylariaceae sp. FL0016]|nr:hypothetical protein F5Y15DRAFT_219487 [Xylariaceae sp. FL0016]
MKWAEQLDETVFYKLVMKILRARGRCWAKLFTDEPLEPKREAFYRGDNELSHAIDEFRKVFRDTFDVDCYDVEGRRKFMELETIYISATLWNSDDSTSSEEDPDIERDDDSDEEKMNDKMQGMTLYEEDEEYDDDPESQLNDKMKDMMLEGE